MKNYKERVAAAYEKAEELQSGRRPIYKKVSNAVSRAKVRVMLMDKTRLIVGSVLALFLCLIITMSLVLFVPYTIYPVKLSAYKGSEYYSVIEKLADVTYGKPYRTTNFKEWFSFKDEGRRATSPMEGDPQQYEEVTDNQVEGVIEGDLFKRSDKYIFYINWVDFYSDYVFETYTINGTASTRISALTITADENGEYRKNTFFPELYLSENCKTVTLFLPYYSADHDYTEVMNIDVSDPYNPTITDKIYVSGMIASSRLTDGEFILFTYFTVNRRPDFSVESDFVPHVGTFGNFTSIPLENIVCPEEVNHKTYTVICTLNANLKLDSAYALLSYTDDFYVSGKNVYAPHNFTENSVSKSEISRLSYDGGKIAYENTVTVDGTVLNQYSMDEYDGIFRVVSTTGSRSNSNANLYCFDVETFGELGMLKDFAPEGESVQSVRFDGDTAYVCTAKVITFTDPVYALDLSDPENITYKDTGTISGYSAFLRKFCDDTLLGIGYGETDGQLKIEVYRETEDGVESVATYLRGNGVTINGETFSGRFVFPTEYKAYLIDAQNGLVGFAISENYVAVSADGTTKQTVYECVYFLLKFDGEEITALQKVFIYDYGNADIPAFVRATIVDNYIYVCSPKGLKVAEISA